MKTILKYLLFAVIITASGCSWLLFDRFQVFNDEFKNSKTLIARFDIPSHESRTEILSARIVFERESKTTSNESVSNAYFVISRSSSSFSIGNSGYVKIGDSQFEVDVENVNSESKSRTDFATSSYSVTDSIKVITGIKSESETRIWIDDKFTVRLSQPLTSALATAERVTFRFYFGPVPATFIIKKSDASVLRKVFI